MDRRGLSVLLLAAIAAACNDGVSPSDIEPQFARIVNPRTTFTYFDLTSPGGGGIHGDQRAADGSVTPTPGVSIYDHGQCGVTTEIFVNKAGDATMDPIGAKVSSRNCTSRDARSLQVLFGTPLDAAFPDLGSSTGGHYTNVRQVWELNSIGESGQRRFRLMLRGAPAPCEYIRYGEMDANGNGFPLTVTINGVEVTSNPIRVTLVQSSPGPNTWEAVSEPGADGHHVALCEVGGAWVGAYDIPFRIVVEQKN